MKTIEIIRACFAPDGRKTPTILKRGSIVTLEDDKADTLIEKKYAAEITKASTPAAEDAAEAPAPKRRKSKEA